MMQQQLVAVRQCASVWQAPAYGGVVATARAQLQARASTACVRMQQRGCFNSQLRSQGRFRVSQLRAGGRNIEELEGAEFDQLGEEDLEALFEEYGETVRNDEESSSVTSEVDEDSDSLAFAVALAEAANDVKGSDIQVLCVKPLIYWARFFVVVTAFSKPQIDAVGKRMRDIAEEKFNRSPKGDSKPNAWTLFDYGDVIVHIFLPKEREFYNLEEFYGNATLVKLPFENRSMQ